MDKESVVQYVKRAQSILEASPQMDEANTKASLIHPFIELLGWEIHPSEVELKYKVPIATVGAKVDYALLLGDTPVVFIEVKKAV